VSMFIIKATGLRKTAKKEIRARQNTRDALFPNSYYNYVVRSGQ
jgi:hypothetical protein